MSQLRIIARLSTALFLIAAAACTPAAVSETPATVSTDAPPPAPAGATLAQFFDKYDAAQLSLSPQGKAYRGIRDADYGRWDDVSDEAAVARHKLQQASAAAMRSSFDPKALSPDDALSFELFDAQAERADRLFAWRDHGYLFDQMNGAQSQLPAFLINIHRVANDAEAEAYVARIRGLGPLLDSLSAQSAERAAQGYAPPKWVYAYVISDIRNLLKPDNAVVEDIGAKVGKLEIDAAEKARLIASAKAAWSESAGPAYARLLAEMQRQQAIAPTEDGVWRMPGGKAYYEALLANYTTTGMTAAQIHDLGLSEVARIHGEMEVIRKKVGFKGTLPQFFEHLRTSPQYYYTTREAYLADVAAKVKAMEARLPAFFNTLPKAPLQVKAVEAFREKSAGKAFYQSPSPDGSRPGTYYVNLYDLRDMSKTELEALAYHEGVPGHHLQRAVQTELTGLPPFRRFGGFTAYTEGWGLYGLLHRSLQRFRAAGDGAVARVSARRRHRHSRQAVEPRAGDPVSQGQHPQPAGRHRKGDRALCRLSGTGDRLSDRQAQDHGAAVPGAKRAWSEVRFPRLSRCRARIGPGAARHPRTARRCVDCIRNGRLTDNYGLTLPNKWKIIVGPQRRQ